MSEEIKETLDDIKRHLDYVEATKQSSIRDNEMKTMYEYITSLQQKVEQLEDIRKEAIKLIEEDILGKKIENVNWDYDECYYSDMPVERIKPLLNILNKGDNK